MKADAQTIVPAAQFGAEVQKMVQALGYGSFAPAFEECIELAHANIAQNFFLSETAGGDGWPPRKVIGDGHPLLIDTGLLFGAATGEGDGAVKEVGYRDASIGVDAGTVPYAAAHNFGYPENNLPQREFEDVSDATANEMAERIADRGIELLI